MCINFKMTLIRLLKFLFAIFSVPGCGARVERKCFSGSNPTGQYHDIDYQLVFVTEKHFLELQCRDCDEDVPDGVNATWSHIQFNHSVEYPIAEPFNLKSKKFKKHMEVTEDNALHIDKVKQKHNGLYSCNTTRLDPYDNSSIYLSFNYLVQVLDRNAVQELPAGSQTDWKRYRDQVLDVAAAKLDDESLEGQMAGLDVIWSNWTDCLCGSYKFDTRRFRTAYPYVAVNESDQHVLLFPTQSESLAEFYPLFAGIVQNVTPFSEYERCVDDCLPNALELDVEYIYEQTVYLPEGSNVRFTCPDSENASDILWVFNDEKVLLKMPHALGTGVEEKHVAVDMLDELYLNKARPREAGAYSCIVDSMPIKRISVTIVPQSIFLSKEFLRCILTIALVLIVCFIICALILGTKIYHAYSLYKE